MIHSDWAFITKEIRSTWFDYTRRRSESRVAFVLDGLNQLITRSHLAFGIHWRILPHFGLYHESPVTISTLVTSQRWIPFNIQASAIAKLDLQKLCKSISIICIRDIECELIVKEFVEVLRRCAVVIVRLWRCSDRKKILGALSCSNCRREQA